MLNISRNKEPVVDYKYVDCLKETTNLAYLTGQQSFKLGTQHECQYLIKLETGSELFLCWIMVGKQNDVIVKLAFSLLDLKFHHFILLEFVWNFVIISESFLELWVEKKHLVRISNWLVLQSKRMFVPNLNKCLKAFMKMG